MEYNEYPTYSWKVPSKSNKGSFHLVGYYENDTWTCDCVGFNTHKKVCRHIRRKQNEFSNKVIETDEL